MKNQNGMTLIGMLLTLAMFFFGSVVVLRIIPVYIQHYELTSSIRVLSTLPSTDFSGDPNADAEVLRTRLMNQLYVNNIESITPDKITITPTNQLGNFRISIKYQVIKPLLGNVSLLFHFETTEEVKASAA